MIKIIFGIGHYWHTCLKTVILALLLILLASPLQAQGIGLLHCATNQFAPYGFKENGQLRGIEVDIMQEIAKRLNFKLKLTMLPWKKMITHMKKGKNDCMFAAFKTAERMEFMDYTNVPIHVSTLVFYVHKDRVFQYQGMEDLKGLTIGLVRGFATSPDFDTARGKKWFTVEEANGVEQNFKKLSKQKINAVLFNHHVGAHTLNTLNIKNVIPLSVPLTATSAYVTFSKKRNLAQLVPKFDATLFNIMADGTYKKIFEKYISSSN